LEAGYPDIADYLGKIGDVAPQQEGRNTVPPSTAYLINTGLFPQSANVKIKVGNKLVKFKIKNVPYDGNCLYHAISMQLKTHSHDKLRQIAANYLQAQQAMYQDFISDGSFDDYINNVMTLGAWGDMLEIDAISKALDIPIIVISSEPERPIYVFNPEATGKPIFLHHKFNCHYQMLKPLSNIATIKSPYEWETYNKKPGEAKTNSKVNYQSYLSRLSGENRITITPEILAIQSAIYHSLKLNVGHPSAPDMPTLGANSQ